MTGKPMTVGDLKELIKGLDDDVQIQYDLEHDSYDLFKKDVSIRLEEVTNLDNSISVEKYITLYIA